MSADYSQLLDFSKKIQRLNDAQREQVIVATIKEIASRVLAKTIKRTPVGKYTDGRVGGTLRRGWTGEQKQSANAYTDSLKVYKRGNAYVIDIVNPVEYASYVEYGHRTRNGTGWVTGKFMLTVSTNEVEALTPKIIEKRLKDALKEVIE